MQTLFEWDFKGEKDEVVKEALPRNMEEFAPGMSDAVFAKSLVVGVVEKRQTLDAIITKAAPDWPLNKISMVDRNILRMGLYELLFGDRKEVPAKVAINEAIELAKTFGGETSGRFVNGVLGTVYKEIGEPGKAEPGRAQRALQKKKKEELTPEEIQMLPVERLAGAGVYAEKNGVISLAFVHDIFGFWTLSKGRVEQGEDEAGGAKREVREEIGIDVEIQDKLGENEYISNHPEKGKIRKRVVYFLARAEYEPLKLKATTGLDDAKWYPLTEIEVLNIYDDILPLIATAVKLIASKKP